VIFAERVAAVLEAEATALVGRWQKQARAVAPRAATRRAGDTVADHVVHQAVVALACALRRAPRCQDDVLRAGWDYGVRAHAAGSSLHYMLKELDLLEAMVLYVVERAAEPGAGDEAGARPGAAAEPAVTVAEALGAARRLGRTFAALRLASAKGFTYGFVEAMRGRYRTLRHDMRNPIGTIRSAVALMDDESLPEDVRFGARYRAMVTRNAASLETLVGAALGDTQVHGPALTLQDVSLAELARTVRRDLRDDAEAAGCAIELAPSLAGTPLPAVRVDSTALELVLRSLVDAALVEARRGSEVTVGLRALRDRSAVVAVSFVSGSRPADRALPSVSPLASELAQRAGGCVWREDDATLLLEMPVEVRAAEGAAAAAGTTATAAGTTSAAPAVGSASPAPVPTSAADVAGRPG